MWIGFEASKPQPISIKDYSFSLQCLHILIFGLLRSQKVFAPDKLARIKQNATANTYEPHCHLFIYL